MRFSLLVKRHCPYCIEAIRVITESMTDRDTISVHYESEDFEDKDYKKRFGEDATYPRIYFDKEYIGGYEDLVKLLDE